MASDGFHDRANERAQALVGRTVDDRYAIDRVIAMGGMGTVYLARHLKLKKRVALKVLHPDAEDHPELFLRFEREAQAGAQVSHPNVAAATDFGEAQDGTRYLVLEYVRGSTLRQVIDSDAPLSSLRAARIVRQLAAALGEIHKRGIVHRDLKPRNVMLGEGDFVKIVDFGLAKIDGARLSTMPRDDDESGGRLTGGGMIFGTVEYLAPEAAYGMDRVDHRADLYALGVIAFEMLSGKHPFEGAGSSRRSRSSARAPRPRSASARRASACPRRSSGWCSGCSRRTSGRATRRAQSSSKTSTSRCRTRASSRSRRRRRPTSCPRSPRPRSRASPARRGTSPSPRPARRLARSRRRCLARSRRRCLARSRRCRPRCPLRLERGVRRGREARARSACPSARSRLP
ncbi:MAG: serine/threonine protein kinase [Polyangiaceae bacterium]|nr:serine/threonine protein kinase [Polyangiaceae bacterium]